MSLHWHGPRLPQSSPLFRWGWGSTGVLVGAMLIRLSLFPPPSPSLPLTSFFSPPPLLLLTLSPLLLPLPSHFLPLTLPPLSPPSHNPLSPPPPPPSPSSLPPLPSPLSPPPSLSLSHLLLSSPFPSTPSPLPLDRHIGLVHGSESVLTRGGTRQHHRGLLPRCTPLPSPDTPSLIPLPNIAPLP